MEVERLSRQMCDVGKHIVQHFSMTESFFSSSSIRRPPRPAMVCVVSFIFLFLLLPSIAANINYFSYRSFELLNTSRKKKASKNKYLLFDVTIIAERAEGGEGEASDLRGNVSNESQFEYSLLEGKQSHTGWWMVARNKEAMTGICVELE
jgi:hypothetical protein